MQKRYSVSYSSTSFFVLLCMIFIPFPFHLFPAQQDFTELVLGRLIGMVSSAIFNLPLKSTLVHSDSISMYVLVLLLFILGVVLALLFQYNGKWKPYRDRIFYFIRIAGCYYLALMLLKYGLDKVFKYQFYLPEPNILYTPLGQVDKDLLYWTSMGTSRAYNIFLGSIEVIAALLLLFKRTRMAGLLIAASAMVQVVMVNFGFDISVKLYSCFLLLLSLHLLQPYYQRLWQFLFDPGKMIMPVTAKGNLINHPFAYVFIKCMTIGIILLESLYPYLRSGHFNDDTAPRPYLHGAYEVRQVISGSDTLRGSDLPVKRFFVHRNSYIIFQDQADKMADYRFDYAKTDNLWVLTGYQGQKIIMGIQYNNTDSTILLDYTKGGGKMLLTAKAIDWKKLPVLKKSFHWTVD
ncbi:MAG: hypothetical protein JNM19_05655 [Chitinophagaceae bacterium]|nr:hypothetical protein [Chitinophagaceae bacterium]